MSQAQKVISSQRMYEGKYLKLDRRIVILPDGKQATREVVIPPNAVAMLPLDADGNIYLVRQYRPAIQRQLLEIPAGILDEGEEPLTTAKRELAEEIGKNASELTHLFRYYHAEGYSTGIIDLFLATGLSDIGSQHDATLPEKDEKDESEFLQVVSIPLQEAYQKVMEREIVDSKSMLAIIRVWQMLQESERRKAKFIK